jgi:tRNA (cmo5U34)-methyltransferase
MSEFDNKAKQWDQNPMHLARTKAVAENLMQHIPVNANMRALEFGAGTGLLSFFLRESFAGITLMDTSLEMLHMAEAKLASDDLGKIKTFFFDLEKSDYPGEQVDVIFTQMVLHHIKDVNAILEKFYNMLLPDGYLAIADLYTEDGLFHEAGTEVHHGFDPNALAIKLKECGFGNISHNLCFVINKETDAGKVREYPIFLLTAKKTQ